MYVWLVLENCCDGMLEAGDLLVYSEGGYQRMRCLPLPFGGSAGIAALDGKLECIHPGDAISLEARAALKLASAVASVRPASGVQPSARTTAPIPPALRLLKSD